MASVIHRDAPAGVAALTTPIRAPVADAAGVCGAEGLQGHQVNSTYAPTLDDRTHGLDDWGVLVVVAREKHPLYGFGVLRERNGFLRRDGDRLFAQNVQAAVQRRVSDTRVGIGRRGDVHELDAAGLGLQHLGMVRVDTHLWEIPPGGRAAGLVRIDDGDDFEVPR